MKKCSRCNLEYPMDRFIKNRDCVGGYAGTCKNCQNGYSRKWKQRNSKRLSTARRKRYADTEGKEVKIRVARRKKLYPLRFRCQMLRSGMRDRARIKNIEYDKNFFTTNYLMKRLSKNSNCECCGKKLDLGYKNDKRFNENSPSMDRVNPNKGYTKENTAILCWRCNRIKQDAKPFELRKIADFIENRGNEVESDIKL
jgi:hypothetical protein